MAFPSFPGKEGLACSTEGDGGRERAAGRAALPSWGPGTYLLGWGKLTLPGSRGDEADCRQGTVGTTDAVTQPTLGCVKAQPALLLGFLSVMDSSPPTATPATPPHSGLPGAQYLHTSPLPPLILHILKFKKSTGPIAAVSCSNARQ